MTTYTRTTGEIFSTRAIGKQADMLFLSDRTTALNAKFAAEGKQVSTIRIDWNDSGAWVCEDNGKVVGRFDLRVTSYKPSTPVTAAAKIDTKMDGGKDSMGMLRR